MQYILSLGRQIFPAAPGPKTLTKIRICVTRNAFFFLQEPDSDGGVGMGGSDDFQGTWGGEGGRNVFLKKTKQNYSHQNIDSGSNLQIVIFMITSLTTQLLCARVQSE